VSQKDQAIVSQKEQAIASRKEQVTRPKSNIRLPVLFGTPFIRLNTVSRSGKSLIAVLFWDSPIPRFIVIFEFTWFLCKFLEKQSCYNIIVNRPRWSVLDDFLIHTCLYFLSVGVLENQVTCNSLHYDWKI